MDLTHVKSQEGYPGGGGGVLGDTQESFELEIEVLNISHLQEEAHKFNENRSLLTGFGFHPNPDPIPGSPLSSSSSNRYLEILSCLLKNARVMINATQNRAPFQHQTVS